MKNNMPDIKCPIDGEELVNQDICKEFGFRGESLLVDYRGLVCSKCGFQAGTKDQTSDLQKLVSDAYRDKVGLLSGEEIISIRKEEGLTQRQLAEKLGVGIASIKRWETGAIQTKSMDKIIRSLKRQYNREYMGGREINLCRIKLVICLFEQLLGLRLLKTDYKYLFTAKYLWYSDFLNYKRHGIGITGACYAALPMGPQLDNYNERVEAIKESEPSDEDQLSKEEIETIKYVAERFPTKNSVYGEAHKERIWNEAYTGQHLDYLKSQLLSIE